VEGDHGYLSSANVVTYEQDWLNEIYKHSPALETSPDTGDAFTDGMAHAAQERGAFPAVLNGTFRSRANKPHPGCDPRRPRALRVLP
jgi:hypothetical protein